MAWVGAEWLVEKEGAKMDVRKERARAGGALSRWEQMGWLEGGCCRGRGWIAHRSVGLTAVWLSLVKGWEMCNPVTNRVTMLTLRVCGGGQVSVMASDLHRVCCC